MTDYLFALPVSYFPWFELSSLYVCLIVTLDLNLSRPPALYGPTQALLNKHICLNYSFSHAVSLCLTLSPSAPAGPSGPGLPLGPQDRTKNRNQSGMSITKHLKISLCMHLQIVIQMYNEIENISTFSFLYLLSTIQLIKTYNNTNSKQ